MNTQKRFISLKAKIIISSLILVFISFALISIVIFFSLFGSLRETAKSDFLQISQKHAYNFENQLNHAMDYLSLLTSQLESQVQMGPMDREMLQQTIRKIFDDYKHINGSSIYFEPNMYDGKDADYRGTSLGTSSSGRIAWYFYMDDDKTAYLPESFSGDLEFSLAFYTEAKKNNKPIYTEPASYEIDGRHIPMITLTYPINKDGLFIGAATVDLFLDDLYIQLQNEKIYETGYMIITTDTSKVIYSPRYEHMGKTREEAGLHYQLPVEGEQSTFSYAQSILNGKKTLVAINSIYISQLDSNFYISATAPLSEINASGTRLMVFLALFDLLVIVAMAFLLYYVIGKISAPLNEITEGVNKIAGGDYRARIEGAYTSEFAVVKDSVNTMADSIEAYIKESQDSLNILKNILNGLDAAIYVTVPGTGQMLFMNDYMKKMYHVDEKSIGLHCYEIIRDGITERCSFCPCNQLDADPSKAVVWEEHYTSSNRDYRKTDRYIDWMGGVKAHLQHAVDITDIRRLSSIVESSPQFILYVTANGNVNYVNPAALAITGYTEEEFVHGGLNIIFDKQTVRDIKEKYIPSTLANGVGTFEIDLFCKNGQRRIMAFSSFTTGLDSTTVGGIANDVTEIRKLESDLIAAKELAEQGSRSKSEFLSRMSHEMRTPMNAIIGMTSIAKSSDDPSKKEYCLDQIENASRHLLGVINDILDMSKIEANKFELSNSEFHFGQMLQGIVDVVTFRIEEKHQNFSLYLDPAIPTWIVSDKQRLSQVIANLLSNAVKFTPDQGIIQLRCCLLQQENQSILLQIEVIDSGIGISDEQKSKLFRSFEQADGSIARKYGGTGLGLAISKRIVELMGGNIWIESELGKGSKFIFTLNAATGESNAAQDTAINTAQDTAIEPKQDMATENAPAKDAQVPMIQTFEGKTALLAEDVDVNREIILTVLADSKLQIECAKNGREAIEFFAACPEKYDIIFMDVHMPEVDGIEATRRIRALKVPESTKVPIIAMTANVFQEDIDKCLNAGMNAHIGKPIDFDILFHTLGKYLGSAE